jgi:protein TonB
MDPVPLRSVQPKYTSDAMRAKIQGVVQLEVVVLENGTVGDVRITRSLDKNFGLDTEAITAARQWLFRPATRQGKPVPIIVLLELEFRLH